MGLKFSGLGYMQTLHLHQIKNLEDVINQEISCISHFVLPMHVFLMNETLWMLYNSWKSRFRAPGGHDI